jgi:hypothetical protein
MKFDRNKYPTFKFNAPKLKDVKPTKKQDYSGIRDNIIGGICLVLLIIIWLTF